MGMNVYIYKVYDKSRYQDGMTIKQTLEVAMKKNGEPHEYGCGHKVWSSLTVEQQEQLHSKSMFTVDKQDLQRMIFFTKCVLGVEQFKNYEYKFWEECCIEDTEPPCVCWDVMNGSDNSYEKEYYYAPFLQVLNRINGHMKENQLLIFIYG